MRNQGVFCFLLKQDDTKAEGGLEKRKQMEREAGMQKNDIVIKRGNDQYGMCCVHM